MHRLPPERLEGIITQFLNGRIGGSFTHLLPSWYHPYTMIRSLHRPVFLYNIPFTIEERRVLQELRVPRVQSLKDLPEPHIARYIKRAIDEAYGLIQGKACYRTVMIKAVLEDRVLTPESETLFQGKNMVRLLRNCDYATLLVCTIGPEIEARIEALKDEEPADAYYLERVGAWMADYMADQVDRIIETEIRKHGYQRTFRYGVGYGDWRLPVQAEIMELTQAHRIGVSLNEAYIMIPRFSVSAVIGWERIREKE